MDVCGHGEAVRAANRSPRIPAATPVFACNEDATRAVEAVENIGKVTKIYVRRFEGCVKEAGAVFVPVFCALNRLTGLRRDRRQVLSGRSAADLVPASYTSDRPADLRWDS